MAKLRIQPITDTRTDSRIKRASAKLAEEKLKGKTQVKLFQVSNPNLVDLEDEINQFLKETGNKITVKDIKLCTESNNSLWTAMMIYEVK